jgi:hypothetical protein
MGLPMGIDESAAQAVLVAELGTDYDVSRWFALLRGVYEASPSDGLDTLLGQFREAARAASLSDSGAEAFAREVSAAGGRDLIERVLLLEAGMPGLYWQLVAWRDGPGDELPADELPGDELYYDDLPAGAAADEYDWANDTQCGRLEQAWGTPWRDYLGEWLGQRWGPGWEQHPPEHKRAWLEDLLPELLGQASTALDESTASGLDASPGVDAAPGVDAGPGLEAAPGLDTPADPWSWVTGGQRSQLAAAWSDGWPERLQRELDGQWGPGWEGHPGDHKTAWLDQLLPQWSPAAVPVPDNGADPTAERAARDALAEQAFTAALDQVPGARELPGAEIEQLRSQFREQFERSQPMSAGQEAGP